MKKVLIVVKPIINPEVFARLAMLNLNLKEGLYRIVTYEKALEVFNSNEDIFAIVIETDDISGEKLFEELKRCRKQDQIILNLNLNVQEKKEVDNSNSDCTTVVREFKITSEARR